MARTLSQLVGYAELALGGRPDPRIDLVQVVNDAGLSLYDLHDWSWRHRPPATLALVSGQDYATLPSDFGFGVIHSVTPTLLLTRSVYIVSLDELVRLRQDSSINTYDWYVAVEYPDQTDQTTPPANARLAVFPTPAANNNDWAKLVYSAGWVPLSAMDQVPNIPRSFEPLLLELVRAHALGVANIDGVGVAERVSLIERTPLFRRLVERSAMAQPFHGFMRGTTRDHEGVYRPYNSIGDAP